MPAVDLIDEAFVVAEPSSLAAWVHDPDVWRRCWPDLVLTVSEDRGVKGIRWSVTGALVGSAEVWLEAWGDGVLVHHYLRAVPTRPGTEDEVQTGVRARRAARREVRDRAVRIRGVLNVLKDEIEGDRIVGTPRSSEREP